MLTRDLFAVANLIVYVGGTVPHQLCKDAAPKLLAYFLWTLLLLLYALRHYHIIISACFHGSLTDIYFLSKDISQIYVTCYLVIDKTFQVPTLLYGGGI